MTAKPSHGNPNDFNDVQDVVLQRFVGIDASIFMPSKWGKPAGLGVHMVEVEVEIFSKASLPGNSAGDLFGMVK